ncbi:MAG TPA: precorrin-2 C(20)-methyltransferase [Acidimicrobiales bacterium]|jgi:precorrin-2/cobalt-factor-2 C20-methyltransferase
MTAMLVGVGVGPGDPELMTIGAVRQLRSADRVVAPSTAVDAVGRAESIVRQAAPDVRVERIPFVMAPGAGARAATAADAAARIVAWLDAGETVAFVTLGDPNVYSTFSTIAAAVRRLRPAVPVKTVPGIMAFQDLAARAGTVLLDDAESLTLVTAVDGPEAAAAALADPSRAVVVYKGGRHLPAIAKALADSGRLDGAVLGELLGLPGERVTAVAAAGDQPASYLATVIVPPGAVGGDSTSIRRSREAP